MNKTTLEKLEFNRIKNEVKTRAIGDYTKQQIENLEPQNRLATVKAWQQETQEARLLLDSGQHVPFMGLVRIKHLLNQTEKGLILTAAEILEVADFLRSSRMLIKFFEKNQYQTPLLYRYSQNLDSFLSLEDAIYQKIKNNTISDEASRVLQRARRQFLETEKEIQDKLTKFIRQPKHREWLQEILVIKKEERFTVPIKASFKNKVAGTIVTESNNGQTAFIEPTTVSKLNERKVLLEAEIVAEEYQILAELTGAVAEAQAGIQETLEVITAFDFIFARGKYSREIKGITPRINKNEVIEIIQGRHPFLRAGVPLDFTLGKAYRGLVITGANAGGKTVVLKTVGLLTLMAMFGLQIPAQEKSQIAVLDHLFVDIGDQQNIDNALSTFSGHMKNVAEILKGASRNTLVLLDEIGSGTEPNEGAALAIAIMENLYQQGSLLVATTHYGEIKRFAEVHQDFIPAAMAFDKATLTPLYRLQVGKIGDSQALWIAKKMAMSETLLKQAAHYMENKGYNTTKMVFPQQEAISIIKEKVKDTFAKGDRVLLTESQAQALVYQDEGGDQVQIYHEEKMQMIPRRRLQLLTPASQLYPIGYDLDTLFEDFKTLKARRDITRGSKKAQKKLDREMQERRRKNAD